MGLHRRSDHQDLSTEILQLAVRLAGTRNAALAWFFEDPICLLDSLTAAELVAQGQGQAVLSFLAEIASREQATTPAIQDSARWTG